MTDQITPEVCTVEHIETEEIQSFDCGHEVWEMEVSDWLKRQDIADCATSCLQDEERPGRLWLYRNSAEELVGFGALGFSRWRWTKKKDPFLPLTMIIWCAVQKRFWGLPEGPKEERYARQIMDHLVTKSLIDSETHPILGLMVHPENKRAIGLYKSLGFTGGFDQFIDRYNGRTYDKMALVLDGERMNQLLAEVKKK